MKNRPPESPSSLSFPFVSFLSPLRAASHLPLYVWIFKRFFKLFIYLAASGLSCGTQDLQLPHANSSLQHVASSSLMRDWTWAHCIGSMDGVLATGQSGKSLNLLPSSLPRIPHRTSCSYTLRTSSASPSPVSLHIWWPPLHLPPWLLNLGASLVSSTRQDKQPFLSRIPWKSHPADSGDSAKHPPPPRLPGKPAPRGHAHSAH